MVETKKTGTLQPKETTIAQAGEEIMIKIMNRSLSGVMFHSYEVDLYDLLRLEGFKKMHEHQVKDESCNLEKVKHKYIETYRKIPVLTASDKKNLWKDRAPALSATTAHEKIEEIVRQSMKEYADWESEVLEHLLKVRRDSTDKNAIHNLIKDVMEELEFIEAIIQVLEERNYSYDSICEMSDYLYKKY